MNLLHLSSYPPWKGGIADYLAMLLDELEQDSDDSHSVMSFQGTDAEFPLLDKDSVLSFWHGFQAIRDEQPDVLHIQHELNLYGRINFLVLAFLLLLGKPFTSTRIVTTLHTYNRYPFSLVPKKLLRFVGYRLVTYPLIFALSDRIIVHNGVIKDQIGRDNVDVIPHGVKNLESVENVRTDYDIGEDDIMLLGVGFLSRLKGFNHIINALQYLSDDYKAVIAGSPPPSFPDMGEQYFHELEDLVQERGLEERVVLKNAFLPEDEIDNLIHSANYVLFPRQEASQSGMMHRAIGAGKKIVCSDLDVFRAVLEDAAEYCKKDDSEDLADKVKNFSADTEKIDELRDKMSWENVAKKYRKLYRNIT
jgi:glycosyltransferase involved in cell wall biosynthesis